MIGTRTHFAAATLAAALMTGGLVAQAQDQGSGGTFSEQFDQAQLEAFVTARAEVLEIQQEYGPRLQAAESDEKAADLQAEAQEKMAGAVDDAGLNVEQFNNIARAAQKNEELRQELEQLAQ